MSLKVTISIPADADSTLSVHFIAVHPLDPTQPNILQPLVRKVHQQLAPGEAAVIELIHGYSSISLHEGQPVVRLPLSTTK